LISFEDLLTRYQNFATRLYLIVLPTKLRRGQKCLDLLLESLFASQTYYKSAILKIHNVKGYLTHAKEIPTYNNNK